MQLSLFDNQDLRPVDDLLTEKANALLEALNEGRKPKDEYQPQYYFQTGEMIVLIAANKEKNVVCNIIDLEGKTPEGFSACWRNAHHIKQELGL